MRSSRKVIPGRSLEEKKTLQREGNPARRRSTHQTAQQAISKSARCPTPADREQHPDTSQRRASSTRGVGADEPRRCIGNHVGNATKQASTMCQPTHRICSRPAAAGVPPTLPQPRSYCDDSRYVRTFSVKAAVMVSVLTLGRRNVPIELIRLRHWARRHRIRVLTNRPPASSRAEMDSPPRCAVTETFCASR